MCRVLIAMVALAACAGAERAKLGTGPELELRRANRFTFLAPVRIQGTEYQFIIDTGASITALRRTTARAAGIAVSRTTRINGDVAAGAGTVAALSLGPFEHRDLEVAIVDLPAAELRDVGYDGILGIDLLGTHDLIIDLVRSKLALLPRGELARIAAAHQLTKHAVTIARGGLVVVDVAADGHLVPGILDLGASSSLVNAAGASLTRQSGKLAQLHVRLGDVDVGERTLAVGNHRVFGYAGLADRPAMLLGVDLLDHRVIGLAYGDRAIYFAP